MTRLRMVFFICLFVVLAGVTAPPAAAEETDIQELIQRIEALENQINSLERNLMQRLGAIDRKLTEGGKAAHPLESEAQASFGKIRKLMNDGDLVQAKTDMTEFLKKYGDTDTAKSARRMEQEVLSVIGKEAPAEWGIEKWFQGEQETNLGSDKTTLLVFWETWCPHCKREVPKLQDWYNTLKDEGLQVVAMTRITKSSTEESVQQFIDENKLVFPIAKEDGTVGGHFSVRGIPAAAVLKKGKVVWRGHPAELNEAKLKGWL